MTSRRFKLVFEDGSEHYCAAFDSEGAREQALRGPLASESQRPAVADEEEPRRRGRPSFSTVLAGAVDALGAQLDPSLPLADRRRRVLRYLATSGLDAEDIPSRSTTEAYLTAHPVPRKSPEKSPRKSARRKITATGG